MDPKHVIVFVSLLSLQKNNPDLIIGAERQQTEKQSIHKCVVELDTFRYINQ
jgi:hypothetical protein